MRVFWDVDTQRDFMNSAGQIGEYNPLPVPKAFAIKDNLRALTRYAGEKDILILGSVDRHFSDDEELKKFPPHCLNNTLGQHKMWQTTLPHYLVAYIRSKVAPCGRYEDYSTDEVQIEIRNHKQILFEKQHTDVFTNRNVMKFLDRLRVSEAVVYGVSTEYCVKDAVLGLLKLGIKVYLVEDAIKGIDKKSSSDVIQQMIKANKDNFRLISTKEVINGWY